MSILLSGFEPFGDFAENPSWDALKLAANENMLPPDTHITRIPVEYDRAFECYCTAVEALKPEAAISFGLHGGLKGRHADVIYVETTARNRDGANKPDNAGRRNDARAIVADGPDDLPATIPAQGMVEALNEAGIQARLSDDAGAYLCNHLFYRALHAYSGRFPYGFVHVPPVESMGGVLSLQDLAEAVAVMARTVVLNKRA